MARRKKLEVLDEENAAVFAELIVDPNTLDNLRTSIIEKILESRHGQDFFKTMFEENLSLGECPNCKHQNHWLVPEETLNQMGYVSHERDKRVPKATNRENCKRFEEACKKKKVLS